MKRRSLLASSAAATALQGFSLSGSAAGTEQPGVIIILTDDQGQGDLSLTGNPVLRTPHLDNIAKAGVQFTDFHAAPEGVSSRSQLLTGTDSLFNRACHDAAGRNVMRRDLPTIADIFRQDGYTTGLFGKWNLGNHYPDRPVDRGFDKAIWFRGEGLNSGAELDNDYENPRVIANEYEAQAEGYCTDIWFHEALNWMSEQHEKGQPFFTMLTPNIAHAPLWPPAPYADLYQGKADATTAAFYAMLANLDDNVGRLDSWLKDSGAYDNTIVLFMSDNGSIAGHSLFNAGMRGFKSSLYEGGHRVPCLLRWPARYPYDGLELSTPVQIQDILPTLLDLCEVPAGNNHFDGRSLAPLLSGGSIENRLFVIQTAQDTRPRYRQATIVQDYWRLVNGNELYDIDADPAQQQNLAATNPDILVQMQDFYDDWWNTLAPDLQRPLPAFIGADRELPEMLDSSQWWEVDAASSTAITQAEGGPRGGRWHIRVFTAGTYTVELRRWPFHTNKTIGSDGPQSSINGRSLGYQSTQIDVAETVFRVGEEELHQLTKASDKGAIFTITLQRGTTELQGWFRDANDRDICGAYFARIRRLN